MPLASRPNLALKSKQDINPSIDRNTEATAQDFADYNAILEDHANLIDDLSKAYAAATFYGIRGSLALFQAEFSDAVEGYGVIDPGNGNPQIIAEVTNGVWTATANVAPIQRFNTKLDRPQPGIENVIYVVKDEKILSLWYDGGYKDFGKDGYNGKSTYQIALDFGFVGTEPEWLDSLQTKANTYADTQDAASLQAAKDFATAADNDLAILIDATEEDILALEFSKEPLNVPPIADLKVKVFNSDDSYTYEDYGVGIAVERTRKEVSNTTQYTLIAADYTDFYLDFTADLGQTIALNINTGIIPANGQAQIISSGNNFIVPTARTGITFIKPPETNLKTVGKGSWLGIIETTTADSLSINGSLESTAAGGGISDAPSDGTPYSRQDADWVAATGTTYAPFTNTVDGLVPAPNISETTTYSGAITSPAQGFTVTEGVLVTVTASESSTTASGTPKVLEDTGWVNRDKKDITLRSDNTSSSLKFLDNLTNDTLGFFMRYNAANNFFEIGSNDGAGDIIVAKIDRGKTDWEFQDRIQILKPGRGVSFLTPSAPDLDGNSGTKKYELRINEGGVIELWTLTNSTGFLDTLVWSSANITAKKASSTFDLSDLGSYADDAAANTGGVAIGFAYINSSTGAMHRRLV